jgi:hypothetical protein
MVTSGRLHYDPGILAGRKDVVHHPAEPIAWVRFSRGVMAASPKSRRAASMLFPYRFFNLLSWVTRTHHGKTWRDYLRKVNAAYESRG